MELKNYNTKELVEELSKREGVERLDTPVEGKDEIAIEKYSECPKNLSIKDNYIYDSVQSGPAVILRIID